MKENHLALFCRVSKGSRTSLTFCCAYSDSDTVLKFAICCSMAVRQTHCFALNDGLDHFSSNISTLYYTADPSQQASRCEHSFRPPKRHAHPCLLYTSLPHQVVGGAKPGVGVCHHLRDDGDDMVIPGLHRLQGLHGPVVGAEGAAHRESHSFMFHIAAFLSRYHTSSSWSML